MSIGNGRARKLDRMDSYSCSVPWAFWKRAGSHNGVLGKRNNRGREKCERRWAADLGAAAGFIVWGAIPTGPTVADLDGHSSRNEIRCSTGDRSRALRGENEGG